MKIDACLKDKRITVTCEYSNMELLVLTVIAFVGGTVYCLW